MAYAATLPSIRPISDLRTKLNEVEREAKERRDPIIMTKNGVASLVVMDSQAFEDMRQEEYIYQKLREAEIEAEFVTETVSMEEMKARTDQIIRAAEDLRA